MKSLLQQFDDAMFNIYHRAKNESGYTPTSFFDMLKKHRGQVTAKLLINSAKPSIGYTNLYLRGRVDLTVEAMVVENSKWQELFTSTELDKARRRLTAYNYTPREAA